MRTEIYDRCYAKHSAAWTSEASAQAREDMRRRILSVEMKKAREELESKLTDVWKAEKTKEIEAKLCEENRIKFLKAQQVMTGERGFRC